MTGMKADFSQLAVFGGPPLFDAPIHVGRPNIGNRERLLARINEILDRRWLSNNGPFVQEFEAKVAAFLGVRHCIAIYLQRRSKTTRDDFRQSRRARLCRPDSR